MTVLKPPLLSALWRPVFSFFTEVLYLLAMYLGIATLVVTALVMTVPTVQDQARHVQQILIAAYQPQEYAFTALPDAVLSKPAAGAGDEADVLAGNSLASESKETLSFSQALEQSEEDTLIIGVTSSQAQALQSYIARKYKIAGNVAGALIRTAFTVGQQMKLDPQLLLAVIAIESRYNPYAESHMGAQGLMQVMTKVHKDKFEAFGEGPLAAVHPLINMQVGAQILSDCINRRGSLDGGLACYVGATGPSDGGYGAKVKAELRRLALASGIPIAR